MAVRLTGTDTNGVIANSSNDIWFTLPGQIVADDNSFGFSFASVQGVSYTVQGTVASEATDAIGSTLATSAIANHELTITETGAVLGGRDGARLTGSGNLITNHGLATGSSQNGLYIDGALATIINHGTAGSSFSALRTQGANGVIQNYGVANGDGLGISAFGDGSVVINHGLAAGRAATGSAMSASGANLRVENYGTASGLLDGIILAPGGTGSALINQGEIFGGDDGVRISSTAGTAMVLRNSGLIQTNQLQNGSRAIQAGEGDETVENTGRIVGDVLLGLGDDRYVHGAGSTLQGRFMGEGGSDTADLSAFAHAIWVDLTYTSTEIWTKGANDLTTGQWRTVMDLDRVENIIGTFGIDLMRGDAQDNTFGYVGTAQITGIEQISGRDGQDTADFQAFEHAVWADLVLNGGEAWTRDGETVTTGAWRQIAALDSIENLAGTMGVDELFGSSADNTFLFVDPTTLFGGTVLAGQEIIDGRGGTDTVDFSSFQAAVWVDLAFQAGTPSGS